eukprot:CAMPEP_0172520048 /NCGR_PEP_ID=MMETSP1066-20121228/291772_1 /TAXON_ID=671091 /ORGANISM="Coscinodiscus wailesii, Strain CCMP2513" /LENGTH=78 /DNA_ID=CAMNT_0013302737 /DNA_START=200 /DNA_END=436 /DNA_ORIENTATION=+
MPTDDVEMNDESIDKIKIIAVKIEDMERMLTEMQDTIFEGDSDADQWRAFENVCDILKPKILAEKSFSCNEFETRREI